jgi:hypothetical protein
MIVTSIIVGFNIINLIDKKINNISVNIPPVKIPKPKVVIKMCDNKIEPFDAEIKDVDDRVMESVKINDKVSNKINDNGAFDPLKIPNDIDGDLNDIEISKVYKNRVKTQLDDPTDEDQINIVNDSDNIEPLNKTKKKILKTREYVTAGDFGYQLPRVVRACQNSSISQRYISGDKKYYHFRLHVIKKMG